MSLLLTSTISVIILKYFSSNSCVYHFGELDIALEANFVVKLSLPLGEKPLEVFEAIKCEGFLISGNDVNQTVVEIEHHLRYSEVFKFNIRRYLMVENSINGNIDVETYFKDDVFNKIADIVLIVPAARNETCLHFYSHEYAGRKARVINHGTVCNDSTMQNMQLYPNSLGNAMGRYLRISTFDYLPYIDLGSILSKTRKTALEIQWNHVVEINKGAELSMVNSFIEKYNYSQLVVPTKGLWGQIFPNFTGTGAQGIVVTGEADIAIACFYPMLKRHYVFDFSTALMRNGLAFLIPKPEIANGITVPLKPFRPGPWCMLLFTLFLFAVLYFIANLSYKKYHGDFLFSHFCLDMIGVLLQQNVNLRIRFLGGLSLFYALMMMAFYTSVLSSIMTKPSYEKYIQSGEDLDQSDVRIFGISDSFISGIDQVAHANIIRKFEIISVQGFDRLLKKTNHLALAIDHLDLGFSLVEYNDVLPLKRLEQFFILEEDLMFDSCCALAYKHSVFMPSLNKHIQRLKETGLDYFWQAESFRNLNYRIQLYMNSAKTLEAQYTQLQVQHVHGAFAFLLLGYLLSLLRFGYEFWIFQYQNPKGNIQLQLK